MNLGDYTLPALQKELTELGESAFRAKQIFAWLARGADSLDAMTDLSKNLREKLAAHYSVYLPQIAQKWVSRIDGTVKYLFQMADGEVVESVVMQYHHGYSICISSQVGCRMGCTFCASTLNGLVRNLLPHEMMGQILAAEKDLACSISNIVIMGIGEPLDNYENLWIFLENLSHPQGRNFSLRHVTLSTCGLTERIHDLANRKTGLNLAISLHAPDDALRCSMMPIAKRYTIEAIILACDDYFAKTGRRITYEYALADGVNNQKEHALELAKLLHGRNCHVNLIPINPVKERDYQRSSEQNTAAFCKVLTAHGINATVRRALGSDISASCGQLRNEQNRG